MGKEDRFVEYILFYCKCYKKGYKRFGKFLYWMNRFIFSCDIPCSVQIGHHLHLPHFGLGVVIHPHTIIGDNVVIFQQVTIGVRQQGKSTCIVIGNQVLLGAGSKVLGMGNLEIGDNVKVGANSVVLHSIEKNKTVVGIPAKDIDRS